ncbi:LysR family transcriptional regulator [Herbaspirillum huttiense]|uniref:LysR family transcriptional regulator n=2 Tax=Herbaspirillum huttiense TaxID=863372 RepID=A0AAJ2HB32_9BURK|nr:LysR family transcriptional regulator [Herbaspirillum huttiense]MDR9838808.1 LysR family transcriptional regulator [Herbaspirillum huttiense]
MTLKQLEAFCWAATCANFAIAAERLHLSVSSLSKRISELEVSLGMPLFDRSAHRALLNEAGQALLPRAQALLDNAATVRVTFAPSAGLAGRCAFGVGELSALTWLPQFIAQVRRQHPQLTLEPYVDVGSVLESRVARGELDFAIIAGRSSHYDILSQPLSQAQFIWVAAPAMAVSSKPPALRSAVDLLHAGQPMIVLPPSAGTTRLIDDWLLQHGITAVERINCNNWGGIAGMLIASVGIGILPAGWSQKLIDQSLLEPLIDSELPASLSYSFQWRRGDNRPLLDQLRRLCTQCVDFTVDMSRPLSA